MRARHTRPPFHSSILFRGWRLSIVLFLLLVTPLWHLHVINRMMPPCKADMVAVWKGVQATFQHHNPYASDTTRDIQIFYYGGQITPQDNVDNPMGFVYPMYTILLFAPIGVLPWSVVRVGFFILLPLLTAASVNLWIRVTRMQADATATAAITILALCSWPVMWGIHQIQPTLIVAFLVAAGCYLLQRDRPAFAGMVFALATIKPQLVALLLCWLFLWAALHRTWSLFVSFGVTLATLISVSFWILPNWIPSFRTATAEYAVYRHLQFEVQVVFGQAIGFLLVVAAAASSTVLLWRNRRCAPLSAAFGQMCSLCLALTVIVLPTERAMTYNYVLLVPACLVLIASRPVAPSASLSRTVALGLLCWSYILIPVAVLGDALHGASKFWDGLPFDTLLLPLSIFAALALNVFAPAASGEIAPGDRFPQRAS